MTKLIGSAAVLVAGAIILAAGAVAIGVPFVAACVIVLVRKLDPRRALTAGD